MVMMVGLERTSILTKQKQKFFPQVSETDWMDSSTQGKAAEKADQMLQLIGYPDWLTDPSQVLQSDIFGNYSAKVDSYYLTAPATTEQDHFGNMIYTGHWAAIQDLKTLRCDIFFSTIMITPTTREEPKRDIWLMHPAIVNAWYSPNHNTISMIKIIMFLMIKGQDGGNDLDNLRTPI